MRGRAPCASRNSVTGFAMTATHFIEASPVWWLESGSASSYGGTRARGCDSDILHLGTTSCRLEDITSYRIGAATARDNQGLLVVALSFVAVAAVVLVGVTGFDWSARFLAVFAFLAVCAVLSLLAAARVQPVSVYRIEIALAGGGSVSFTSGDPAELGRIAGLIEEARGAAGKAASFWPVSRAA